MTDDCRLPHDRWPDADRAAEILGRPGARPLIVGADLLAGQNVLVTGAGGTVGGELCRLALRQGAARVVAVEHSEFALFSLGEALADDPRLTPRLASAGDERAMREALETHVIDTVFHAAAYKHVALVQANPAAGLANNVLATRTMAEAARRAGARRFVLVSTDKAAKPVGVMGASKRMAEIVVQDIAARDGPCVYSIVRFGNVFGSSGSVVPRFARQIAAGGPVTLSDARATRYFVTLREAGEFVIAAATIAGRGDILTLDMGAPVPIRELAERMIRAAGRKPGEIGFRVTGLAPGERLHEDPGQDGALQSTAHDRIRRIEVPALSEHETAQMLRDLGQALSSGSEAALLEVALGWTAPVGGATPADPARVG